MGFFWVPPCMDTHSRKLLVHDDFLPVMASRASSRSFRRVTVGRVLVASLPILPPRSPGEIWDATGCTTIADPLTLALTLGVDPQSGAF